MISALAEPITRVAKISKVLQNTGFEITYWGWDRQGKYPDKFYKNNIYHEILMRSGGEANKYLALKYPVWLIKL